MGNNEILENIKKIIKEENIKQNEPMKNHTSFKIGGPADFFIKITSKEEANNIDIDYIRILGFNNKGKEYLHNIKKEIDIPILTNYDNKYLNMELRVSTIIGLLKDNNYYESEYKNNVIKKD